MGSAPRSDIGCPQLLHNCSAISYVPRVVYHLTPLQRSILLPSLQLQFACSLHLRSCLVYNQWLIPGCAFTWDI